MMSEVPPPTIWDILKIQDISPGPEDRLVTCMDAKLEPACPVIPQVALHFRDLDEEDKTTFRRCRPHQQHQIALVTFLRYARGHHIEPPAELYRNLCRRVPSVDSKKRWACGMKGCKTGDTLEHIKTHLHGLTHFSYRFFPCPNCEEKFCHKHDRTRHIKDLHTNGPEDAAPRGGHPDKHRVKIRKGDTNRGYRKRSQDRPYYRPPTPAALPDHQERGAYTIAHIHQASYQVSDVLDIDPVSQASLPSFSGGNGRVTDYMGDQHSSSGNTTHQGPSRLNKQYYPGLFAGSTPTSSAQINQLGLPLNGDAVRESIMNPHQYTPDASQSTTYPQSDGQCNHEPSDPFALNVNQNQAIRVMQAPALASDLPTGHGFSE